MSQLASGFLEQQLGVAQALSPFKVRSKNDDRKNLQALCNACHKKKTSFERKMLKLY